MSKNTNVNRVAIETLVAVALEQLPAERLEELKGWIKVNGAQGRRLYFKAQALCGEIHVAGWLPDGWKELSKEEKPSGSVTTVFDMSAPIEETLERLRALLEDIDLPTTVGRVRATKVSLNAILAGAR